MKKLQHHAHWMILYKHKIMQKTKVRLKYKIKRKQLQI